MQSRAGESFVPKPHSELFNCVGDGARIELPDSFELADGEHCQVSSEEFASDGLLGLIAISCLLHGPHRLGSKTAQAMPYLECTACHFMGPIPGGWYF